MKLIFKPSEEEIKRLKAQKEHKVVVPEKNKPAQLIPVQPKPVQQQPVQQQPAQQQPAQQQEKLLPTFATQKNPAMKENSVFSQAATQNKRSSFSEHEVLPKSAEVHTSPSRAAVPESTPVSPKMLNPATGSERPMHSSNKKGWVVAILVMALVIGGIAGGVALSRKKTAEMKAQLAAKSEQTTQSTTQESTQPVAEVLNISKIDESVMDVPAAEFLKYDGEISEEEEIPYTFTAPVTGDYRLEMAEMINNNYLNMELRNDLGESIDSAIGENGEGISAKGLQANEEYTLILSNSKNASPYVLSIGLQKESVDVGECNVINDSVEFRDQRNLYLFVPEFSGTYRFEIAELYAQNSVYLKVLNRLNETVENAYCENENGVTVENMQAGEQYCICVCQYHGFSTYSLKIGRQKPEEDITGKDIINDSIQFTDQCNVYRFEAKSSSLTIGISNQSDEANVQVVLRNHLGEEVASAGYMVNGDELLATLNVGEQYELCVSYSDGFSQYSLRMDTGE